MKHVLIFLLAALLPLTACAQQIPSFDLLDAEGNVVNTTSLIDNNEPFAIIFWATWCHACRRELENLTDESADWEKPFRLYAVCLDDSRSLARAKALAANSEWPVTVLYDTNSEFARALSVSSIPRVFVFNKKGEKIWTIVGYMPGCEDELIKTLTRAR